MSAEEDVATWDEIKITSIFTAITTAGFLLVFEYCRRLPSVSAVFDRRRASKPNRTPPPLMKSWFTIGLEWLFLSCDPYYIAYADVIYRKEAIHERKKNKGWKRKMKSLAAGSGIGGKEGGKVNKNSSSNGIESPRVRKKMRTEDTYAKKPNKSVSEKKMFCLNSNTDSASLSSEDAVTDEDTLCISRSYSSDDTMEKEHTKNNKALEIKRSYPSPLLPSKQSSRLTCPIDLDDEEEDNLCTISSISYHVATPPDLEGQNTPRIGSGRRKYKRPPLPNRGAVSVTSKDTTVVASGSRTKKLQPSSSSKASMRSQKSEISNASSLFSDNIPLKVVEVMGRRLPTQVAEPALAGDLSERQLCEYEAMVDKREKEEEEIYEQKCRELWLDGNLSLSSHAKKSRTKNNEPTIPNRFQYFILFRNRRVVNRNLAHTTNNASSGSSSSQTAGYWNSASRILYRGMRHLKSTSTIRKRPLSIADAELLRCVGLDTFVMLRFLRFCFDVTFYPFLLACVCLIPTYYTNPYEIEAVGDDAAMDHAMTTSGYFRFTINRLEPGSPRHWVSFAYAILFHLFVLRRLWVEWETFIMLRFDFLANGDVEMDIAAKNSMFSHVEDDEVEEIQNQTNELLLQQNQYRNSVLVECIPDSHRRDKELYEFFDAVFPGQVKRAEILLNANKLTNMIQARKSMIIKYENLYAKHVHARAIYRQKLEKWKKQKAGKCSCFVGKPPKSVRDPMIDINKGPRRLCCCCKKYAKALPHYLLEIDRLNNKVEEEHRRITEEKMNQNEDRDETQPGFITSSLTKGVEIITGYGWSHLTASTGFVEFKSLTAKQNAVQCNITGTNDFMVTTNAPDPRDIIWENATVPLNSIKVRSLQCVGLLLTGTIFWSAVVVLVLSFSTLDWLTKYLPQWLIPPDDSMWYPIVQGYVPVVSLEVLMFFVPLVLRIVCLNYIRYKTKSDVDTFVYQWHYVYRLVNLVIIILSGSLKDALNNMWANPQDFLEALASGISRSSQFFLNNAIVAAGTETMWELAQMPNMIMHFIIYKYITVEAKSKRALEKLQEPNSFEWGDVIPMFIFSFVAAIAYSAIVPFVTGACAVYFFIANKVYTHQALFVYSQHYEGGGKLMYKLSRTVLNYLYFYAIFFGTVLGLKGTSVQALTFSISMVIITVLVDHKIRRAFVEASTTLALTNARIIDEERKHKSSERKTSERKERLDDKDFYLYRQPQLNKVLWETQPRPYR